MNRYRNYLTELFLFLLITLCGVPVQAESNSFTNIFPENLANNVTNRINVATDPDKGRSDFEQSINNPTEQKTPSSVTVKVSDQISNLEKYKKEAMNNGTYASAISWESLKKAYSNQSITYIEILGSFSAPKGVAKRDLGWRETSVIIDGGGNTVNMQDSPFNIGKSNKKGEIFTITNIDLIHWETAIPSGNYAGYADGVIDSGTGVNAGYGYWNFNIDNVTLKGPEGMDGAANSQPRRLLDAEDSQVTLSGKIIVEAKGELMQIGQVDIANNAHVELNRTPGTSGFSMFYFMSISADKDDDTGFAHTFKVGDGATVIGKELASSSGNNYPLVYWGFNSMTIGDNVTWSQDGFQMLLDLYRYSGTKRENREVTFGQGLNMTATRTVGNNSLYAANKSTITFNAGTILNLEQWNPSTVVNTTVGSTITFISPKSLHLSRNSRDGSPSSGALFTGAGTFSMNNSQISTWQDSDSSTSVPAGNRNQKFAKMTVIGGKTKVTPPNGIEIDSDIIDTKTRELKTTAIAPGTIKVNYIDQNGKKLGSKQYPINKQDNYIGQFLQLRTEEYVKTYMPENYMWAIDSQVKSSAIADGQSGGDSTTTADNGDKFGQATVAIVPMEGTEYTYNIYVYGKPTSGIQYQYKDLKSDQLLKSEFPNSEQEKSGTALAPANYANKIDWTSSYYTNTVIPDGYHYANASELGDKTQPKQTNVGTEPVLTTIYVYPDKQTVKVTLENSDGTPLVNQTSPIYVDGYSGLEISYKDLLEGKITQQGSQPEEGMFTFDYTDNKGSNTDKAPQDITIKLKYVLSKMGVKQVYKGTDDPIYRDLANKIPVDNSQTYEEVINDDLQGVMRKLIFDGKFNLNYDGYDTTTLTNYKIYQDGHEITPTPTKVPSGDFTIVYEYSGQLRFKDTAENLQFGSIPITKTSSTSPLSDSSDKLFSIISTMQNSSWTLKATMPNKITRNEGKKETFNGKVIYKNKAGLPQTLGTSAINIESQENNNLFSEIDLKTGNSGLLLQQDAGNLSGTYQGKIIWTLQDSQTP
ncbi:pectate lyase-like adhesive domain-containing protein [Vagococcus silagei]|uniref:WxL domain-containing protein n=1 Tax=Vagococcus silagei TaxID=2508885 RepID=A0A4S3B139_9ENTE|nr:pectate lyase-like adhesive domain-containing protein [Vagococcus silagei]THB60482.1 hypothetical protein ESZ54_10410 [Vagococcus silagei]